MEASDITSYFPFIGGLVLLVIAGLHCYRTRELGLYTMIVLIVGGVFCSASVVAKLNVGRDGVSIDMNEVAKLSVEASEELIRIRALTQEALANISKQVKQLEENQRSISVREGPPIDENKALSGMGFPPWEGGIALPKPKIQPFDFDALQLLQKDNDKLIEGLAGTDPAFQSRLDDVQRFLNMESEVRDSNSMMR